MSYRRAADFRTARASACHNHALPLQVTNALLRALDEATAAGLPDAGRHKSFAWIAEAHAKLAGDMGIETASAEYAPVAALLEELKRLLDGIVLTQEVSPRLRARVAAFGELLSSQLGAAYLRRCGVPTVRVDSRALLTSDIDDAKNMSEADMYLEADVRPSTQIDRANAAAQGADTVICQGFIASTPTGATCLLGRGGSDTSAALFAAFVGAQRLEIWTDVNGMFTADPRFVSKARLIRSLTYREAQELAAMGAKVLHPRCLLPAAFAGIPVEVRNTMDPDDGAEITVVSTTGLDYLKAATVQPDGRGAASGMSVVTSSSPGFHAMPPLRAPSPLGGGGGAGSRIVYSSTAAPHGGVDGLGRGISGGSGGMEDTDSPARGVMSPGGAGGMGLRGLSPSPSMTSLSSAHQGSGGTSPVAAPAAPHAGQPAKVLAVARRKGVTLVTLSAFDMWGHSGFLTKVFAPFTTHGVSVDLIATSQYAVSLTLDHIPDGVYGETFRKVVTSLFKVCSTTVRYPCAVVSVVGRSLRNALPQLGRAMAVLEGVPVHMVSEASEDLNMSFVVDEDHADTLVRELHAALLESNTVARDPQFGPVWTDMPCGKAPLP